MEEKGKRQKAKGKRQKSEGALRGFLLKTAKPSYRLLPFAFCFLPFAFFFFFSDTLQRSWRTHQPGILP